jgi:hypothetical protein
MTESVRFSELKLIAVSAAHYAEAVSTPRSERPSTPAQLFGTSVHAMTLGGDLVVYPGERRGNAWKDFATAHKGRPIITSKEAARAEPVSEAVRRDPVAAPLLEGAHEVELEWELCGRRCAGRIDVLGASHIADLKTASTAHPDRLRWQARKLGYIAQLAWYAEGARQNGCDPINGSHLIAVEMKPPSPVTCMRLTERALDEGMRTVRLWLERLRVCEDSGAWPGYAQTVLDLDVPDDDVDLVWGDEEDAA